MPSASAGSLWRAALAPRQSSRFNCNQSECRQQHPRLPDSGEWTCAERDGVVWCVGGEPAAGVARGIGDARFRCGPRWGKPHERVCVDEQPEYPQRSGFVCRFEQESGLSRVCRGGHTATSAKHPRGAVPACWFDKDCRSGVCDRGVCACREPSDCERGQCRENVCVEATR